MKKLLAAASLVALMAAGPALADDSMAVAIGNTLVAKDANGAATHYHFAADNTYHAVLPDKSEQVGTWSVAEGKFCVTPKDAAEPQCGEPLAGQKLGDTWETTDAAGAKFTLSLLEGVQ